MEKGGWSARWVAIPCSHKVKKKRIEIKAFLSNNNIKKGKGNGRSGRQKHANKIRARQGEVGEGARVANKPDLKVRTVCRTNKTYFGLFIQSTLI